MAKTPFHAQTIEETLAALGTSESGLSNDEAVLRLQKHGPNALPREAPPSVLWLVLKQFRGTLTYVLFGAVAVSLFNHHVFDAIAIGSEIIINGVVGFFQERKAERALARLRDMVVPKATVLRGGARMQTLATQLVPGDVVSFTEGDRLPADLRMLEGRDVRTDESALTGESSASEKAPDPVPAEAGVADRDNMLHMGTLVTSGEGLGVVTTTGINTAFGQIAQSLAVIKRERTPLETRVDALGKTLGLGALGFALVIFLGGLLRGNPLIDTFLFAVSAAVSAIPEGLPVVLAIVLAIGVQRMARRNAVIRHLPAVETLGVVDVICTDKTGTLTENKMTVRAVGTLERLVEVTGEGWNPKGAFSENGAAVSIKEDETLSRLVRVAALCNRATVQSHEGRWQAIGEPTEAALVVLGLKAGFSKTEIGKNKKPVDELPFSSARRFRAVIHGGEMMVVGALETLLERATITPEARAHFEKLNTALAARAMRVIAVAVKDIGEGQAKLEDASVQGLTVLGLVGMIDPPRHGVAQAIAKCAKAGIRVIMMTGDHEVTAVAVAKEIGIDGEEVYHDAEVSKMSDAELDKTLETAAVFARVSPETKLRVVTSLRRRGHVVAMTGDGINDAPALKRADIGVAMGITGTDVTKEVADMILTDDNFVSIVNAVEEGRIVFRDVKQTTSYLVMTNVGEVVTIMATLVLGLPLPLLPAQLLWLNVVTDGFTDVTLATEPSHGDELARPPIARSARILTKSLFILTAVTATMMAAGTLMLFQWARTQDGIAYARTVAFLSMSLFQLWNVFNMRAGKISIFTLGWFSNRWVFAGVAASVGLIALIMYVPFFQPVFRLVPLGWHDWALALAVSATVVPAVEGYKWLIRKGIVPLAWV